MFLFYFLCWRMADLFSSFLLFVQFDPCFSLFMGEYLFFEWPKKRYQKKGHPTVLAFGCSVRFS